MKPSLRLEFCGYEAAKYAATHWHYSGTLPAGKMVRIGVWESDRFIGVVLFGYGANQNQGKAFGLTQHQICELTRVALDEHETEVTRILAIALKMLKRLCPGIKLVFSYADTEQGHTGGIYAGNGWIYAGMCELGKKGTPMFVVHGVKRHGRSLHSYGWKQNEKWLRENVDPKAKAIYPLGKHKFYMPLDEETRKKVAPLAKPYPKRSK